MRATTRVRLQARVTERGSKNVAFLHTAKSFNFLLKTRAAILWS